MASGDTPLAIVLDFKKLLTTNGIPPESQLLSRCPESTVPSPQVDNAAMEQARTVATRTASLTGPLTPDAGPQAPEAAWRRTFLAACTLGLMLFPGISAFAQSVAIHAIQGAAGVSPLIGQMVTTRGVVTGVKGNGFFIQSPEAEVDDDPQSSEGIFVFTSSAPPGAAAVGNTVQISGRVAEYVPSSDSGSLPLTELAGSIAVTLLGHGAALPTPVPITTSLLPTDGGFSTLEHLEGMRVQVAAGTVVGPTGGTVDENEARATSSGLFYIALTGVSRPFREPGVHVLATMPTPAPCCVPRFDGNPERLRIESKTLAGAVPLDVATGQEVQAIIGPLDFVARSWTIHVEPATPVVVSGQRASDRAPTPGEDEVTIATWNLNRLFDDIDDPGVSEPVVTPAGFTHRLRKLSLAIRTSLGTPDILAVQEVECLRALNALAQQVNADAGRTVAYLAYLEEGNDVGGIDVGFLVNNARVRTESVEQVGTSVINPLDGNPLHDRPPLILRAFVQPTRGLPVPVTVIANHLRSLSDIEDASKGARVRAKRQAQAEYVARLVQERQDANPSERIVVLGDLNAFEASDGMVDVVGIIRGAPVPADELLVAAPDLVAPDMTLLTTLVPSSERYSYVQHGSAQTLDHILLSASFTEQIRRVEVVHANADFADVLRNDATRPERVSDHDAVITYLAAPHGVRRHLRSGG
jgi:predicted extracellular nuclease